MTAKIQYYTNDKGQRQSVIVPFSKWEALNKELNDLKTKMSVFQNIQDGVNEVKEARKSGEKLQKLSDFINECRG